MPHSSLDVLIPDFIANSLTTWPQFLPGTLCSRANFCQLMAGGAEGCACRSSKTACLFQLTLLKSGECVFVTFILDLLDGGVSKHWSILFRWYERIEWSSASTAIAAVF